MELAALVPELQQLKPRPIIMYKTKACLVIPNIDMLPTWVHVVSNSSPRHVEFEFGSQ